MSGAAYEFKLSTGELMFERRKDSGKKAVTDALRLSEDKMFMLSNVIQRLFSII